MEYDSLETQVVPTGETSAIERTGEEEAQRDCHEARFRRNVRKIIAMLDMTEHEEEDEDETRRTG